MNRAVSRQAEAKREKVARVINAEPDSLPAALGDASDVMMAPCSVFFRPCCVRGSGGRAVKGEYRMGAGVGWVALFRRPVVVSAGGGGGRAGLLAGR